MQLSRLLSVLAEFSRRRAALVLVVAALLTCLSGWLAVTRLGVTTDTDQLFDSSLPWRQRQIELARAFPMFNDLLVVVIDATVAEEADETANQLAAVLAADHEHFRLVWRPDSSPYFEKNGLLFLDEKALTDLMNRAIDAQPFLGQLAADPSLRGLFAALNLIGIGVDRGQADLGPFRPALNSFDAALKQATLAHPRPLSWEKLLAGSLVAEAGDYRFVRISPQIDYGALEPGGAATAALRRIIQSLPDVAAGEVRVRITGDLALTDEEFATVAHGMLQGTIASVVLIALWLFLAVRSWRTIVPILRTLALGLSLTTAFAAAAVGTLNLVSLAFAILFVGIAVDFAIQFSVRLRASRLTAPELADALAATAWRVGPQILVAAAATAAGFLAFTPTSFAGVAELGLIAGVGMIIALLCTLLFLPAALTLFHPPGEAAAIGFAAGDGIEGWLAQRRGPVLAIFGVLAVAGAVLLPHLSFDSDPLHTKNPHTEAMQALNDLLSSPFASPYSVDILAPSVPAADAAAERLRTLPLVGEVLTLSSFVPTDQAAKLALIADAANILMPTLTPGSPAAPVTAEGLRLAARTTAEQLDRATAKVAADDPLRAIDEDLHRLAEAPDATLLAANAAATRFLPLQLARLRTALSATPVTLADVPPDISRDWQLPDGRVRVEAMAKPGARTSTGLRALVQQVQSVAPEVQGSAPVIVESAATIIAAFRTAAIAALAAIAVILALVLRRVLDVALVMAPLLLGALMTVVCAAALSFPLNFANVIALPLLLGVGVSFNIYFVMNWRAGRTSFLGTATARAIVFSALTTGTAFGSLAASRHPGTASMGELLLLSLGCTLVATLAFLPTLLHALRRNGAAGPCRQRSGMA
jgi:hopanoid biosynthesis associated RND transporter like protein HpnN